MRTLRAAVPAAAALGAVLALTSARAASTFHTFAPRVATPAQMAPAADEVIVQFRDEADEREMGQAIHLAGGKTMRRSGFGKRFLVSLDAGFDADEAMARLRTLPGVAYAERNGRVRASQTRPGFLTPNDRFYRAQWNMRLVDAERTWGIQTGSSDVIVAVLDTGVAFEDFGPFRKAPDWGGTRFVAGFDFVNQDSHPNDDEYHGTHVSSTIAEATNNREGMAGLAFGCAIMPVKVLDDEGNGSFFNVAEGVDFAVRNGAKVINLSLGGPSPSTVMQQAVDRAVQAGVTVVAASGNDGEGRVDFPAALPNVIAVGAVDGRKALAPYSNFGSQIDVVAPGGDGDRDDDNDGLADAVFQQMPDPDAVAVGRFDVFDYFGLQGTSMATPHVAALAALLYSQGITQPAAVQAAIEQSAEDLGAAGRDDRFGHGLIRPSQALRGLGLAR
jgi:serine protease